MDGRRAGVPPGWCRQGGAQGGASGVFRSPANRRGEEVSVGVPQVMEIVVLSGGRARFTLKARQELAALGAGLDEEDACDVLAGLAAWLNGARGSASP
jgi:hypothetical protein